MFPWLRGKLSERKARRAEQSRLAEEQLLARLRQPDFDLVLRHFNRPVSAPLRDLYSNVTELCRFDVTRKIGPREENVIYACWYIPLDEQAWLEQGHQGTGRWDFANDGSGSTFAVDPTDDDAEIFFFQHEDQTFHATGVKLRDYLRLAEI